MMAAYAFVAFIVIIACRTWGVVERATESGRDETPAILGLIAEFALLAPIVGRVIGVW